MSPGEEEWDADRVAFRGGEHDGGGPLAEEFATLTARLLGEQSPAAVLEEVVLAAHRVIPGADLVSVTVRAPDGGLHTPVGTDPLVTELDQLQYRTGEGPCLEAARTPGPAQVRSDDLATEATWPAFGPAAAALGVRAVLSVALLSDTRSPRYSGALNLYSRNPGALSDTAHEPALLLATHASLALARSVAVNHTELVTRQLRTAIDSRDVIGQAKGILMARRGISADEAFDQLRRASQELNVKLSEVARILASQHLELNLPEQPRQVAPRRTRRR